MNHIITIQREPSEKNHTYGELVFEDFKCFTIEDTFRQIKVPGETRICAGTFPILLRQEGGMHQKAAIDPRFRDFHIGMFHLQDIPEFKYIYIHWGVTAGHTDGCIIVGKTKIIWKGQPGLGYSSKTYEALYKKIIPYLLNPEDHVFITIKDSAQENYYGSH